MSTPSPRPADRSPSSSPATVLVAGGGTAGHIEPALAVADALVSHYGDTVRALGTPKGLEKTVVPARGHSIVMINPVPVPRKVSVDLVKLPLRVVKAVRSTARIIKDNNVDAVIGFGGYVSAPAYLAAALTRTPFFVHEANARAGMANKLGAALGATVLTAVGDCGLTGEVVGIPVRESLAHVGDRKALRREAAELFDIDEQGGPVVLVTGGSQGAARLNQAVADSAARLVDAGYQVLHVYGPKNSAPETIPGWTAVPFVERMDLAYAIADMVVCRSGAMTVAEVTAAGLPAVYVPLPHGNGEQALNARSVVSAGAAVIVPDAEATGDRLVAEVQAILGDQDIAERMRQAARGAAAGSAATVIAEKVHAAAVQHAARR